MEKVFAPQDIERRIYQRWESNGWFAPQGDGAAYCITIPPPNVTGTLHMGHAFQHTLMDALTRYHRMRGDRTLWQPGTDHAGIATQMVVERQLNLEGKHRRDMTRDAFLERVWAWKAQSGGTITSQMRRLGDSVDWSRDRFTMDPGLSAAVIETFVRLHREGLIYRGKRLVNWDPILLTALSDLEVQSEEEDGSLWHLRYPLENGAGYLVVATTRPETMFGDAAVAVHPDDERYQALVGAKAHLPLAERNIPIIADTYVDPEFGTGCVKITPAHDFNDYEVGQRHQLPLINVMTPTATMNDAVPERFRGLDRFEARRRVIAELEAAGLIERIEKHRHAVPRGDRSGAVLEPLLTDQWYVRIAPLAKPAIEAVESGRTRFVPEGWSRTYLEWMRNIKDWCVSRQLWWGHRIPAWYAPDGTVYVGRSEDEIRRENQLGADVPLRQDEDVLDTWFSSALWPFSTLGWPERTPELARFYPTNVLVTGFDIIPFWVARMMMFGLNLMGEVPFRDVYITGLIRDEHGDKMSKSKGNVIDPLDIVDGIDLDALVAKRTTGLMQPQLAPQIAAATRKAFPQGISPHGTDALRFTLAALASPSRDIRFDLQRVAGYRNFCNKLWNAARYVTMLHEPAAGSAAGNAASAAAAPPGALSIADRWIRSRFGRTLAQVEQAFTDYRFDYAAAALYEFAWYAYCDWYLELTKPVLQSEASSPEARAAARRTLAEVLEALQRALHPIMPFITEALWERAAPLAGRQGETIMLQPYPTAAEFPQDEQAEDETQWIQNTILALRQIRGEMNIAPSRRIPVLYADASAEDERRFQQHRVYLERLAGVETLEALQPGAEAPESATALIGRLRLLVPMRGLIDAAAEAERLSKLIRKAEQDLKRSEGKLASDSFVRGAPEHIVATERGRVEEMSRTLAQLRSQLERVQRLNG